MKTLFRYSPVRDCYYRYVANVVGEHRFLIYQVSGDSLVLSHDGEDMDHESDILQDVSWDRMFFYFEDSLDFSPLLGSCLALVFM